MIRKTHRKRRAGFRRWKLLDFFRWRAGRRTRKDGQHMPDRQTLPPGGYPLATLKSQYFRAKTT